MHAEPDVTGIVRSWLRADEPESADRVLRNVLAVLDANPQRQRVRPARRPADIHSIAKWAIAAAAVVVIAVVSTNLSPPSREAGGAPTSPSPSPSATAPHVGHLGLPPVGATPSTPEGGELVLRLEGTGRGPLNMLWVYGDGRMIWHRFGVFPEDASEASIGLHEQRLTPEGVEFLRSQIIATQLFESDLALARDDNAPFLEIEVRNGDRLVRATWAWRGTWQIGPSAPSATTKQARTLTALKALLTDPSSWPASAWEDRAIKAYVPSRYSVCFRGIPNAIEPDRILGLLPVAAQNLLRSGDRTQEASVPANGNCSRVTTDDARALAQILTDAGIGPDMLSMGQVWLRYRLEDLDAGGNVVWISFGPVLPHGEATWLGPG
jgi:hypothetical protein